MSIRTLMIWIIVAGALGGAVLLVQSRQRQLAASEPAATTRTIGVDPAAVVAIERVRGDERETLQRDPVIPDQWIIEWDEDGASRRWAADPVRARSGLRALATAGVRTSDVELIQEPAGEVVLIGRKGERTTVRFGSASSGGRTPVTIERRDADGVADAHWHGWIEKPVAHAFMASSLLNWRRTELFDFAASAVREVALESGPYASLLLRTPSGWRIEQPIEVHAETQRVETMVKSLLAAEAADFVERDPGPETTGLDEPIARIRMRTNDETAELRVGGRADVQGNVLYARYEQGDASALVTIATEQLAQLTAVPDAYVGKTASRVSTTQVRSIRVLGRNGDLRLEAVRSANGWQINGASADSLNRDAVDRLLRLIVSQPANAVRVFAAETDFTPIAGVELVGADGSGLAARAVTLDRDEGGMRVLFLKALKNGGTVAWALSGDEAQATGAWLTAIASRPNGNN